jgi:hypothetical protein
LGVLLYELLTDATTFDKTRSREAGFDALGQRPAIIA